MSQKDNPMKFDTNYIIGTYNLKLNQECKHLDALLNAKGVIASENEAALEKYRQRLVRKGAFWNEEELKMRFIAFLFDYVDIEEDGELEIFFERSLAAPLQGVKQNVKCDCLLARPFGIYEPQAPYFFLQEFKKQKQNEDAEGQMLLAMLIAQQINKNGKPLYGCFLQGRYWVFSVLHDHNYCISRTYEVTRREDLEQVVFNESHGDRLPDALQQRSAPVGPVQESNGSYPFTL